MNRNSQLICAWAGPLGIALSGIGLWPIAHFFPPHLPSASATTIAALYQQDANMIRLGMLLLMIGAALWAPFIAAISIQLKRIEGASPVMAYTQLAAGAIGVIVLTAPVMVFTAAAFRPERAPELTQLLNDLGWLLLVMPFGPAAVQLLAIGLAILADTRAGPIFPRWLGFFNLWVATLFVPAGLVTFFKTGPFAWNGLFGFWIPAAVFGAWVAAMFLALLRAIGDQARQH